MSDRDRDRTAPKPDVPDPHGPPVTTQDDTTPTVPPTDPGATPGGLGIGGGGGVAPPGGGDGGGTDG
jgi:hypothetical protein